LIHKPNYEKRRKNEESFISVIGIKAFLVNKLSKPFKNIISLRKWTVLFVLVHFLIIIFYFLFLGFTNNAYEKNDETLYSIQNLIYGVTIFFVYRQWGTNLANVLKRWINNKQKILKKSFIFLILYLSIIALFISMIIIGVELGIKLNMINESHLNTYLDQNIKMTVSYPLQLIRNGYFSRLFLYFINLCFLAPVVEEIFYRRFLYISIRSKTNVFWGCFISSIIFGLIHPSSIIITTIVGVYLSLIYEKEGSLPVNMILHGSINFIYILVQIFNH